MVLRSSASPGCYRIQIGSSDLLRAHLPEGRPSFQCMERKRYRNLYLFSGYLLTCSHFRHAVLYCCTILVNCLARSLRFCAVLSTCCMPLCVCVAPRLIFCIARVI